MKSNKFGEDFWKKYWTPPDEFIEKTQKSFKADKVFAMGLMPVRGPAGFRKLDYEFAEQIPVKEIITHLEEHHFNVLGVVIKDTDGACLWNTKIGWNPTNRDILGEFVDAGKDSNIRIMVSMTSMNDAYQGHIYPDRVSIHGGYGYHTDYNKNGEPFKSKYHPGDSTTRCEGEMRVDIPTEKNFSDVLEKIPFLQNKIDAKQGAARGARGKGYVPTTSFMCPNSGHVDYLVDLAEEVVKNYKIEAFFADYIRYDGSFTDICCCERCVSKFIKKYGDPRTILKSNQWYDFKEDTIASYGQKLSERIKNIDSDCLVGWFSLPGPKLFTRNRLGQNWTKLGAYMDSASPMIYPYLTGTRDDGLWWGFLAWLVYRYSILNMKNRMKEFNNQAILAITNSVECNVEEMLKQMRTFDFGLGIALFKYYGTSKAQWKALKKYALEEYGLDTLGL
ncbi:MAG: hypothetical protein JW776_00090 [Candidatus Lokiarchaeota archaeon]|nr:hypothetical protein [Candidatus Lokiarchaeota archaeon]